jgi:nitroreductase
MKPITDVNELFRHQRAIRSFSNREVPDELVQQVLTAATHAPSGSNTQPWHFIVIRDQAVKDAISEVYEEIRATYRPMSPAASGDRQPLSAAPVLIVVCVNTPASGQAGFQTGASIYPSVQNLMLAARAIGLGTVLTTLHRRRKERIHEILGIPDHIESAAIIPLGWPDRAYGPNRRPPVEQFIMHDRWNG